MSRDDGIALTDYEATLVVAALCRYASQDDVHPAHRDRCERLAGTLAGETAVTLRPATGPRRAESPAGGVGRLPPDSEDAFRWGPHRADG